MSRLGSRSKKFWNNILISFLVCRGKHNFENLGRYSDFSETTIRNRFAKSLDFLKFNLHLNDTLEKEERIIAFDPSYLSKSGKHTAGINKFWSGCAGSVKWGLEIGGFASIGLESKTAMHLIAEQTIDHKKHGTLMDFYISIFNKHSSKLKEISNLYVADAYFTNFKYINAVTSSGFTFIGKFASNNVLRYRYLGEKTGKRGRPKQFDGCVDKLNLSLDHFSVFYENEKDNITAYQGVVNVKMLKRDAKCIIIHEKTKNGKIKVHSFFSTDITMDGAKIQKCYKLRFQIEFLYRDAKQFTGLSECQARSKEKIHSHINLSLTTVSLSKAVHYLSIPLEQRKNFFYEQYKNNVFQ